MFSSNQPATNVSVTFQYTRGYNEIGTSTTEEICTPQEFQANYQQLCADRKAAIDQTKVHYPPATYKIKMTGTLKGKTFDRTFISLEAYFNFLNRNDLIPDALKKLKK
jgi:hypothetical protein